MSGEATAGEPTGSAGGADATAEPDYAERLIRLQSAWWKRAGWAQLPYKWHTRWLRPGRTLDVGCGIGRNLRHIGAGAVGVDHNAASVAVARSFGLTAYTSAEFPGSADATAGTYDTLLLAHIVEHMGREQAVSLLRDYLRYLRPGGRAVFITPQEAGYRTDSTHVRFVDFAGVADLAAAVGLEAVRSYSFPFPRIAGRVFPYNEFVTLTRYPAR